VRIRTYPATGSKIEEIFKILEMIGHIKPKEFWKKCSALIYTKMLTTGILQKPKTDGEPTG